MWIPPRTSPAHGVVRILYFRLDLGFNSTLHLLFQLDPIASRFAEHIFYAKDKVQRGDFGLATVSGNEGTRLECIASV